MRTQATKLDVLEAQQQRRKTRRDLLILVPLAIASLCVMGVAFAGFLTPLQ